MVGAREGTAGGLTMRRADEWDDNAAAGLRRKKD